MGLVFSLNCALPASQTPFCFSSNQNEAPSQFLWLFPLSCLLLYPEFIAVWASVYHFVVGFLICGCFCVFITHGIWSIYFRRTYTEPYGFGSMCLCCSAVTPPEHRVAVWRRPLCCELLPSVLIG